MSETNEKIEIAPGRFQVIAKDSLPAPSWAVAQTGLGFALDAAAGKKSTIHLVSVDGVDISQLALNLSNKVGEWWIDVLPGLDLSFQTAKGRVRTVKRLKDKNAPRTFTWDVVLDKGHQVSAPIGRDNEGAKKDFDRRELQIESVIEGTRYTETWTGLVETLAPKTRLPIWTDDPIYPVTMDPTVGPTAVTADWKEDPDGTMFSTGYSMKVGKLGANVDNCGLYFSSLAVPKNATITSATLGLHISGDYGGDPASVIAAEAADNPPDWSSSDKPDAMVQSTAKVTKTWVASGDDTATITTIVQEIVNRAGWVSGNAIRFGILGAGTSGQTTFSQKDHPSDPDPFLTVVYTTGGARRILTAIL